MKLGKRLLLFDYVSGLLGGNYEQLARALRETAVGRRGDGHSHFLSILESRAVAPPTGLDRLREYDLNILRHETAIGRARGDFHFTYFQYLAALLTELYLDLLATDPASLLEELRDLRRQKYQKLLSTISAQDLRKLAVWMATGAGKTLLMHLNLLQYEHYSTRPGSQLTRHDNVILVTPSESLSTQHLAEFQRSAIPARHAIKDRAGAGVQVIEITKLYVDADPEGRPRGGVSLPTDTFEGHNLVLVDEGHKGSTTRTAVEEERKWRRIRASLAGSTGFTFEYSATFAQITEKNNELLDEYGKSIIVDYGYRRFWGDHYGKDFSIVNLKDDAGFDRDELLLAGLLVLYEQRRRLDDDSGEITPYGIAEPLMVFVGQTVTGGPEVLQILGFLARVQADRTWAEDSLSALLAGTSGLPADLFTHRFPYLDELGLSGKEVYADLQQRLLFGTGPIHLHLIRSADGEIGIRTADAGHDRYCGVVNVGDATGLVRLAEAAGITIGEEDHISPSLFRRIEAPGSSISLLVGSKKFSEGWSSWRVSVMGLLRVGRSSGPQIIQLFGRGVRLRGKGFQLKRSEGIPGSHPKHIELLETLHVFGLKADYMKYFLETLTNEGFKATVERVLPLATRDDVDDLELLAPEASHYDFGESVLTFIPGSVNEVTVDLTPHFDIIEGLDEERAATTTALVEERQLPLHGVDEESVFLGALAHKQARGWHNIYVTREAVGEFLRKKVKLLAPKKVLAGGTQRDREAIQSAAMDGVRRGLDRFAYAERRRAETTHLTLSPVTSRHANFPTVDFGGATTVAYRLQVPEDLVRKFDKLLATLASGKAPLEDMSEPLPRLHIEPHLYAPMLARHADVDERGQQISLFPSPITSTPTSLEAGEVRFLRDLRTAWEERAMDANWADYEIYVLRNLPRRGVGFFETVGFYPDFMVWLKRGDAQALAFVEPHGMVIWDPDKVALLQYIRELGLSVPTLAFIVTETRPRSIGAIGGKAQTNEDLRRQHILFQHDTEYVQEIVQELRVNVDRVLAGQYAEGDEAAVLRQATVELVDDEVVSAEERFAMHLPVYSLEAAAGYFGEGRAVERLGWVQVDGRLDEEMFVARAVGRSMEPRISDGDLCVFRKTGAGTREGKIVLAQWVGEVDPDTGASYTIKRYSRERGEDGRGLKVTLSPLNTSEYQSIVLTPRFEDEVAVIAEFVEVLRPPSS